MKIDESSVTLNGRHGFESEHQTEISHRDTFRSVFDSVAEAAESLPTAAAERRGAGERVRLMLEQLIAEIIALLSGKPGQSAVNIRDIASVDEVRSAPAGKGRPQRRSEFARESVMTETIREHESSDFSAKGVIRTGDGKSFDFRLDLAMCRDFQCRRQQVERGTVILRDPLVINFDGKAPELASTRFDFDLDSDGTPESIHGLAGGSAFLALDRNGDGRVNDGSELFGARSGDGFADLARLDGDGNGWLDEADPAFASLRAWSRDADGKDSLDRLNDAGVGAIYLGAAETPFSLTDEDNRLRGQLRASGVYVHEDGRAGCLHQIDLAV